MIIPSWPLNSIEDAPEDSSVAALLARLGEQHVGLSAEGGKIRVNAPAGP
jgi:hypothetical protein